MCSHDSNSESVPLDKDIFGYFHWAVPDTRFSYWFGKTSVFFSPSVNNRQRPACGGLLDNGGVSHSPVPVFLQLPLDITASFTESTDPCSSVRVSVCVRARVVCVDVESGGFILLFAPHPFQKRACLGRLPSYLHLCVSRRQICTTAATFSFFLSI